MYQKPYSVPAARLSGYGFADPNHGIGVCSYCNLCNSQKPGARSAPVLPTKPWSAVGFGIWFFAILVDVDMHVIMLGSAQVRACFAEKTVRCGKGFLAKCSGPHRSAPNLPSSGSCSSAPVLPRTLCSVLAPGQNA